MKSLQSFGQALLAVWRRSRSPWAQARHVCMRLAGGLTLRAFEFADGSGIGQDGARKGVGRTLTALETDIAVYRRGARDKNALVVRSRRARDRPGMLGSGTVAIRASRVPAASGLAARHSAAVASTRRPSTLTASAARSTRWPGATGPTASAGASPARSCGHMRRSPKVSEVLPILYLRGLSTGDAGEALPVLLGKQASGLWPDRAQQPVGGRRDLGYSARRELSGGQR